MNTNTLTEYLEKYKVKMTGYSISAIQGWVEGIEVLKEREKTELFNMILETL